MNGRRLTQYIAAVFTVISIGFTSCTKDEDSIFTPGPTTPTSPSTPSNVSEQKLLQLVNNARTEGCNCGNTWYPPVAPVSWDDQLESAAQAHSNWMNQNNTLSHTGANGSDPGDRITAAGYQWRAYGENVAVGYPTEEAVIQGWLNSEGHCKNIMNGTFTEMGVAVSGRYWTQEFATPRN